MARTLNRLTTKEVDALREPGFYADGGGLYLRVDETLNRRWVWVYFWRKKRREMGLGPHSTINGLKKARAAAEEARRVLAEGRDPIEERRREALPSLSFGELAEIVITELEKGWRSPKAGPQWRASLTMHAAPIMKKAVAEITTEDVTAVLDPIWQTKAETARRVRSRIERVLDVAKVRGFRQGENPARFRGDIKLIVAKQKTERGHHEAMDWRDVPAFIQQLQTRSATAARALEFAILTGARTTEVREAVWGEIDGRVWNIPASRMKANKAHRVPLSGRAEQILEEMRPLRASGDFVFPGDQRIEPLSRMAMLMLLRRMDVDVTVHGFRSAFRDWAGDATSFPRELIEEALAHAVGSQVERAYRRSDALEKRRALMDAWADFCAGKTNVVQFGARA